MSENLKRPTFYIPFNSRLLPEEEDKGFKIESKEDLLNIPHVKKVTNEPNFAGFSQQITDATLSKGGVHSFIASFNTEDTDPASKYRIIGYLTDVVEGIPSFVKPITIMPKFNISENNT